MSEAAAIERLDGRTVLLLLVTVVALTVVDAVLGRTLFETMVPALVADACVAVAVLIARRHLLAATRELRPDVCLLDIRMPSLDGLEATRLLAGPDVADPIPVVVVTTFDPSSVCATVSKSPAGRGRPAACPTVTGHSADPAPSERCTQEWLDD